MNATTILDWLSLHETVLFGIVMAALGLSVGLESLLTKFKVQSKKIAFTLLHLMTALSGLVTMYFGATGKQAVGIYASLSLIAGFWHRFVVSEVNTKYVTPFLKWLANQNTDTLKTDTTVGNSTMASNTIAAQTLSPTIPSELGK